MPPASTAELDAAARRAAVPIASMPGRQVTGSASITETVTGGGCMLAKKPSIILVAEHVEADDAADDDDEQHDGQDQSPDHSLTSPRSAPPRPP